MGAVLPSFALAEALPSFFCVFSVGDLVAGSWACRATRFRFWPARLPPTLSTRVSLVVLLRLTVKLAPGIWPKAALTELCTCAALALPAISAVV